jgi:uncharacterized protein YuzB (UPF0349 family)
MENGFNRRIGVLDGFARAVLEISRVEVEGGRSWIPSSIESFSGPLPRVGHLNAFEGDCKLSRLEQGAFCWSELTAIHIPASVEMIDAKCFSYCGSLASVTFAVDCKLSRLEQEAFWGSGLTAIHIPASVEVICLGCFTSCTSLVSVTFAVDCKLSRLEQRAFGGSGLIAIRIPASVEMICEKCFYQCPFLVSITFDRNSRFRGHKSELLAGKKVSSHDCSIC